VHASRVHLCQMWQVVGLHKAEEYPCMHPTTSHWPYNEATLQRPENAKDEASSRQRRCAVSRFAEPNMRGTSLRLRVVVDGSSPLHFHGNTSAPERAPQNSLQFCSVTTDHFHELSCAERYNVAFCFPFSIYLATLNHFRRLHANSGSFIPTTRQNRLALLRRISAILLNTPTQATVMRSRLKSTIYATKLPC
jgi:hypothetical protein